MICCVHCANSPCLPGWLPVCLALCPSPLSLPPSVLHAVVVVVGLFSCFFFLVYFLPTFLAVCSCCLSSPFAAFVYFTNKSTQHIMVLAIIIVQVYTCVDWYTCSYMYNICTFSLFPFIICLFSFLYLSLLIVPLNSLPPSPPPKLYQHQTQLLPLLKSLHVCVMMMCFFGTSIEYPIYCNHESTLFGGFLDSSWDWFFPGSLSLTDVSAKPMNGFYPWMGGGLYGLSPLCVCVCIRLLSSWPAVICWLWCVCVWCVSP